jgi:Arc/MetJ family transcription regulator
VRTNIDIDDALLAEAQALSGASTKKDAVRRGLELLVRIGRQSQLKQLRGQLRWEGDLDDLRRDA